LTHVVLLYIDPGSGSYLVQVIIAGVLGALFYFKGLWFKIKGVFRRNKKDDLQGSDKENA
jgi:TRAP-type uncharacterized transport system fused permease subunit